MEPSQELLILKVDADGVVREAIDRVASEFFFTILLNGHKIVSMLATPTDLDALAAGFLCSEGFLSDPGEILSLAIDEKTRTASVEIGNFSREDIEKKREGKTIASGCGGGVTFRSAMPVGQGKRHRDGFKISIDGIRRVMEIFRGASPLFRETGGVHSAAITDGNELLVFTEDIGRHNAVDKAIGRFFLRGISMADKAIFSSGRISAEIMGKIVRAGIPMIVSQAAPTCMSVGLAEDHGVTLVGFARGMRMNVYSHPWRIDGIL